MTASATAGAARVGTSPGPGRQAAVTAALFVDLEGVRARYECLLCRTVEGPVFGTGDVTAFVDTIRTVHRARCSASAPQQGERR